MKALWEDEASDLPALIRKDCQDLLAQIAKKAARIDERTAKLKTLVSQSDRTRRLQTIPGIGTLTAVAVEAFGPDMAQYSTWHSSKQGATLRLGRGLCSGSIPLEACSCRTAGNGAREV
ncbi:MAG: hypothetical protein Q4P24_14120 [Rhodobacterales bacterium]|nr:hypothetical protein [Rhodobacterales bacterium]